MRAHMVPVGFGALPSGQVKKPPAQRDETDPGADSPGSVTSKRCPKAVELEGF
jgi:hypothetical protein